MYISVTMQHKIVTVTLIHIHNMFRSYTAIIRCPRYAKLFTALLVSILKLKLKLLHVQNRKTNALHKRGYGRTTKETHIKEINTHQHQRTTQAGLWAYNQRDIYKGNQHTPTLTHYTSGVMGYNQRDIRSI
jgi:hypothetical protein